MNTSTLYANWYLDWWCNYLTVARFAEGLNIHPKQALKIISIGRIAYNDRFGHH